MPDPDEDKVIGERMQLVVDAVVQSHAGSGEAESAVTALKSAMLAHGLTPQTGPEAEAELRRIADKIVQLRTPD